ncbi:MAG: (d)CMP kinase [Erysipelotrichaceae bacterium]|nr:(d)CMP kinase [Erysipelotrichaceae bacterium]
MKKISIAIDGPSAAGKSTIAKRLAEILDYTYIDTGAMYRSVAYYLINHGIDLNDEKAISDTLNNIHIKLCSDHRVILNGDDVTLQIRQDEISKGASCVGKYKAVREHLVKLQQEMSHNGGVILDGRDIGSVVLPHAELKIYQEASVVARAKRRYLENQRRNIECSFESIQKDIEQRDYDDMHREFSPLVQAKDAIKIDTSLLTIEEVVDIILKLVNERLEG